VRRCRGKAEKHEGTPWRLVLPSCYAGVVRGMGKGRVGVVRHRRPATINYLMHACQTRGRQVAGALHIASTENCPKALPFCPSLWKRRDRTERDTVTVSYRLLTAERSVTLRLLTAAGLPQVNGTPSARRVVTAARTVYHRLLTAGRSVTPRFLTEQVDRFAPAGSFPRRRADAERSVTLRLLTAALPLCSRFLKILSYSSLRPRHVLRRALQTGRRLYYRT
jgi:hypothetical protein